MSVHPAKVLDLGRLGYQQAWDVQRETAEKVASGDADTLIFVEHDPVLTLGANFHEENLLYPVEEYQARGIDVIRTDRGGDVTYHGPRQLVIYPIFHLDRHGRDLHLWLRNLEETMIATCRHFGVAARRFPPHTGAWIGDEKVAAIGVKVKKWVNLHGIALNCDLDLDIYDTFVPCGISEYGVTSLSEASAQMVTVEDAKPVVRAAFAAQFSLDFS